MKNITQTTPEYARCPEPVKRKIDTIFAWTLSQNPYPQSLEERISWIHTMEKALKTIEAESVMLFRLDSK